MRSLDRRHAGIAATGVVCAAVLVAAASGSAATRPGAAPGGRPTASATTGAELDRLAAAIDSRGRGAFVAIYSGLFVNVPRDEVVVYVTDTHRGAALIREAERAVHPVHGERATLRRAPYSKATLAAQAARLANSALNRRLMIATIAVRPNATGLDVTTAHPHPTAAWLRAAARQIDQVVHVPVSLRPGAYPQPLTATHAAG